MTGKEELSTPTDIQVEIPIKAVYVGEQGSPSLVLTKGVERIVQREATFPTWDGLDGDGIPIRCICAGTQAYDVLYAPTDELRQQVRGAKQQFKNFRRRVQLKESELRTICANLVMQSGLTQEECEGIVSSSQEKVIDYVADNPKHLPDFRTLVEKEAEAQALQLKEG